MAKRVASLYFEDTNIRLLIARGKKAERWASIPLEPGLVSGGVIVDEILVAKKIQELFTAIRRVRTENTGIKKVATSVAEFFSGNGKIIVGLSGRDSLYRVLSLPPLPDSMLGEAVRREAGRVLPVSLNDLYLAYQRIPGSATETRVFVAAFPKNAADILIRTMGTAGFKPRALDLAPLAICMSVNEPRAIIADARSDSLTIVIMAERVPQVIRSLNLQSETKSFSENMSTIIEEFSRTVAFYNSSHPQDPLGSDVPVFVSGDLANEPDSWKSLVGGLDSKVTMLPVAIECPKELSQSEFIVNIGLAVKELALDKQPGNYSLVNLNALPSALLPKPINFYRIIVPVVAVVGVAGIVLMWNTWQSTKNDTGLLQSQLTNVQNQIASNDKLVTQLTAQNQATQAQIQPLKDAANVFVNKLATLETARNLTTSDVHQMVSLAPPTVIVSDVTYADDGMTVTGSSATKADVLNYAQSLRDTGGFNVVVSSISYGSSGTYQFSLQIK